MLRYLILFASLVGNVQPIETRTKYMIAYASTMHVYDDHEEFFDALTNPGRHLSGWDGEEIMAWTMYEYRKPVRETVDE